jgi:DNA-binding NarL/FixJ family response regulator
MPLLVNYMKWRARENKRSIVGAHNGGKSLQDVWHHDPLSLDAAVGPGKKSLMDLVTSYDRDPFGWCIVSGFEDDLSANQRVVAEQIVSGYTDKESARNLDLTIATLRVMKAEVRCKAIEHLV